jgi:hypothetical protein
VQKVQFPKRYDHAHPPVRSVNEIEVERLTAGQRAADRVATIVGSWRFIGIQSAVLEHLSAQDEALAKIVETLAAQSLNGNSGTARG